MTEQWQELKETIIELRDNDGTCTQQEVCRFLVSYMDILEKQIQEPKTGEWDTFELFQSGIKETWYECPKCKWSNALLIPRNYCPNCGARMVEPQERSGEE